MRRKSEFDDGRETSRLRIGAEKKRSDRRGTREASARMRFANLFSLTPGRSFGLAMLSHAGAELMHRHGAVVVPISSGGSAALANGCFPVGLGFGLARSTRG